MYKGVKWLIKTERHKAGFEQFYCIKKKIDTCVRGFTRPITAALIPIFYAKIQLILNI